MLIQAMPIYNLIPKPAGEPGQLTCLGTMSSAPQVSYRISGPNMKGLVISGRMSAASQIVSVALDKYSAPFSISVGQGETKIAQANNISSPDAIVTYGYFGANPPTAGFAIGAFVIVRVP